MALFKRRAPREPIDTGHPGDDALLTEIAKHSDLGRPREWTHYLHCADQGAAIKAAAEIQDGGWELQLVDRSTERPGWVVIAERHTVTSPAAVREARAFFEQVASHVDGGEYDGWEAGL